jgi:hypothetical protein
MTWAGFGTQAMLCSRLRYAPLHSSHITADKMGIKDFPQFAYRRTSFIREPSSELDPLVSSSIISTIQDCFNLANHHPELRPEYSAPDGLASRFGSSTMNLVPCYCCGRIPSVTSFLFCRYGFAYAFRMIEPMISPMT